MFSPTAKTLADISIQLWLYCRKMGMPASVKLSYTSNGRSLSRYLKTDHFVIRLSDHEHRNTKPFDGQIIVRPGDDPQAKMAEAMTLLRSLLGEPLVAAA